MDVPARTVAVLPSPRRLIESLRDVGYDLPSAIADLVDNSIAAQATRVEIHVEAAGLESWLSLADNGVGMDSTVITESLRLGSERSYEGDDLGKFGLGLKTASLSQCRTITVASRTEAKKCGFEARRFDLDRIIRDDRWEVEILDPSEIPARLTDAIKGGPGTVVHWGKLDRLVGMRPLSRASIDAALLRQIERVEEHLSMVFHRFLEGDVGADSASNFEISINGRKLLPWNPFAPNEKYTRKLPRLEVPVAAEGTGGIVGMQPYVLPSQARFSSPEAFDALSGPAKWNQQQGFYVYRANRMIQSGGWSRTRAADEHTKLARVALDFYPVLDSAFGINIAKMRVQLPAALREAIKPSIQELIAAAKTEYVLKKPVQPIGPRPKPTGGVGPSPKPTINTQFEQGLNNERLTASTAQWPPPVLYRTVRAREALEHAAILSGESDALTRIVNALKGQSLGVASALGW